MATVSSDAPAPRTTPTAVEGVGASPPSDGWVREASMRWLDDSGRAWQWRLGVTSIGTGKAPFYRGGGFVRLVAGTDFGKESSSNRPKSLRSKIQLNGDKIC
jgi:hypothetical protein